MPCNAGHSRSSPVKEAGAPGERFSADAEFLTDKRKDDSGILLQIRKDGSGIELRDEIDRAEVGS